MVRLLIVGFLLSLGWLQAHSSAPSVHRQGTDHTSTNLSDASIPAVERRPGVISRTGQFIRQNPGAVVVGGALASGAAFYLRQKDRNGVRRIDRWCENAARFLGYEDSETSSDSEQEESGAGVLAPDDAARLKSFKNDLIDFLNGIGGREVYARTYSDILHRIGNARTIEEAAVIIPTIENFSQRCCQAKAQQEAEEHRRALEVFKAREKQAQIDRDYALALHMSEFHDGE